MYAHISLQNPVLLCMQVDWGGWAEQDRTPMQKGAVSADKSTEVDEAVEKEEGVHASLLTARPLLACSHGCRGLRAWCPAERVGDCMLRGLKDLTRTSWRPQPLRLALSDFGATAAARGTLCPAQG